MISDVDNESESNDDCSIGSDNEWHKHVSELLIDDTVYWLLLRGGIVQSISCNCDHFVIYYTPHLSSNHSRFIHLTSVLWLQHRYLVVKQGETGPEMATEFRVYQYLSYLKGSVICRKILGLTQLAGSLRFITIFTRAYYWTISWSSWIECRLTFCMHLSLPSFMLHVLPIFSWIWCPSNI
jgi:hypothetical protein